MIPSRALDRLAFSFLLHSLLSLRLEARSLQVSTQQQLDTVLARVLTGPDERQVCFRGRFITRLWMPDWDRCGDAARNGLYFPFFTLLHMYIPCFWLHIGT